VLSLSAISLPALVSFRIFHISTKEKRKKVAKKEKRKYTATTTDIP
jgi:hypothetical protein